MLRSTTLLEQWCHCQICSTVPGMPPAALLVLPVLASMESGVIDGPTTNWTSARTHWNRSSLLAVNRATIDIGVIISNHLYIWHCICLCLIPRKVSGVDAVILISQHQCHCLKLHFHCGNHHRQHSASPQLALTLAPTTGSLPSTDISNDGELEVCFRVNLLTSSSNPAFGWWGHCWGPGLERP